jgi:hypothetical protein
MMRWFEMHQWKPADDERLRALVLKGVSHREIARLFRKSLGSVSGRIFRIKVKAPPELIAAKRLSGLALGSKFAAQKRTERACTTANPVVIKSEETLIYQR